MLFQSLEWLLYFENADETNDVDRVDATEATLARFGMPPAQSQSKTGQRLTMRAAAHAVVATIRMKRLAEDWQRQSAIKDALKDAYRQARGKAFVPSR